MWCGWPGGGRISKLSSKNYKLQRTSLFLANLKYSFSFNSVHGIVSRLLNLSTHNLQLRNGKICGYLNMLYCTASSTMIRSVAEASQYINQVHKQQQRLNKTWVNIHKGKEQESSKPLLPLHAGQLLYISAQASWTINRRQPCYSPKITVFKHRVLMYWKEQIPSMK